MPDALSHSLAFLTVPATVGLGLFGVRTLLSSALLWWPSIAAFGETPPCDVVFTGSSSITYWASLEALVRAMASSDPRVRYLDVSTAVHDSAASVSSGSMACT